MTTKKTQVAAKVAAPTQEAQQPVQAATTAPAVNGVTGIQFAKPKAERKKSDRAYCDHTNGKGDRCQLRVLEGRTKCVNHVPAEERLTQEEAQALLTLTGGLDEAQQIRLLARTIGWYKVKQLVSGKPEGDVVLNELIG